MTDPRPSLTDLPFAGFPAGARAVPLPAALLSTVFPQIDDVAELLVTLYAVAAVQRLRRYPRLVDLAELRSDRALIETLTRLVPGEDLDDAFGRGLEAAVRRGALLRVEADGEGGAARVLMTLNSVSDRRAVERVRRGQLAASLKLTPPPSGRGDNVYALYEATIGPITPQIADELAEAEGLYARAWLDDAFREAAELNKRSWRYVRRILERWDQEGRDDETAGRHSQWRPDPRYEHLLRG